MPRAIIPCCAFCDKPLPEVPLMITMGSGRKPWICSDCTVSAAAALFEAEGRSDVAALEHAHGDKIRINGDAAVELGASDRVRVEYTPATREMRVMG